VDSILHPGTIGGNLGQMARHRTFNATSWFEPPRSHQGPYSLNEFERLVLFINATMSRSQLFARRAMDARAQAFSLVQELSADVVRTSKITPPVPSVVRLQKSPPSAASESAVSRKGILFRTVIVPVLPSCKVLTGAANSDHVIPRSRAV